MTIRQRFLKAVYPAYVWICSFNPKDVKVVDNTAAIIPPVSFYSLEATQTDGTVFSFEQLRGKKVLIVNTASGCGYTAQYDELQRLYKKYDGHLVIMAFPSNDFRRQESEDDEQIAIFCRANYRVSFPLMRKTVVTWQKGQHPVYEWLTHSSRNGWNNQPPYWNFSKYLVDENGILMHYFAPGISPLGEEMRKALEG